MSASLLSDMESFKAANPNGKLEDFIRWYSPRDWIEEENAKTDGKCYAADSGNKRKQNYRNKQNTEQFVSLIFAQIRPVAKIRTNHEKAG